MTRDHYDGLAIPRSIDTAVLEAVSTGRFGGFFRRLAAAWIDLVIGLYLGAALGLASAIAYAWMSDGVGAPDTLILVVFLVAMLWYQAILNSTRARATLGRRAMGLIVVRATTGERVHFGRNFLRATISLLSLGLVVPNLLQPFTKKRQSLADLIAGTVVLLRVRRGRRGIVVSTTSILVSIVLLLILGGLLVPAQPDYTVRARVLEGLAAAQAAEMIVAENASAGVADLSSSWDPTTGTGGSRVIRSLTISPAGVVTLQMTEDAHGVVLTLTPYDSSSNQALTPGQPPGGEIRWLCRLESKSDSVDVPPHCRN
ncbi:MAG: RDD family protein [Burkholderiaceae bacterium]|jgi:type IV pilus assembly protein PilA